MDGEVLTLETPLHYRVRPGALRVFVPAKIEDKTDEKE
jgi:diacylglycerol kinase family enzyme